MLAMKNSKKNNDDDDEDDDDDKDNGTCQWIKDRPH